MIASWSTADFFTEGSTDEELNISYTFLIPSIYKKKELSNMHFESQFMYKYKAPNTLCAYE